MTSQMLMRQVGLLASIGLLFSVGIAGPAAASTEVPAVGDCLSVDDAFANSSAYEMVDCAENHNSEVYEIVAYPDDAGAPSTLSDEELSAIEEGCSFPAFDDWLGAEVSMPMAIWHWFISVPSDEAWEAGGRDVLCRTVRPTPKYDALVYSGAIPELFAKTPLLDWLLCTAKTPKSGVSNSTSACAKKSKWLLLGGASVKGKVTSKYPKDLQKAADKACASLTKKFAKKGTKPVAALLPKDYVDPKNIFTECFVAVKDWNGKAK